ncbi:hypothetical protein Pla108_08740 [Botrimarina colliarenosi]|uniref:GGDEF domain-containing protein n=1 Tax=Botrimarina colliarenosi TaxID=2528001 RepID=A0A5C6AKJ6_9BACT|nr:hypothetical protein [Botrimarina colliarenosi]TWT99930.1 hypothetical protein Pla108_08740 [Botrimarina colliarenosi]
MLLFVFFVATMNLAVGYALGAGLTIRSLFAMMPTRAAKPVIAEVDDAEPLTRPAPVAAPTQAPAAPVQAVAPAAATGVPAEPASAPAKPKAKAVDVIASLSAFREQLTAANVELKLAEQDAVKFEQSATNLQKVNHNYLEETEEALKQLDELGAAGDQEASATRDAVSHGASEVAAISSEIDGLIEGGFEEEAARKKLVEKSGALRDAAIEAEKEAVSAVPKPTPPAAEAVALDGEIDATFAGIDDLFEQLEALLDAAESESVNHLAAVRVDPIADAEGNDKLTLAAERAVAGIAKELLAEDQVLVPGRPALILLNGDSFEAASKRVEQLRQQVEATQFTLGGVEHKVTITCAIADAHQGDERDKLVDQLNGALEESMRVGVNRTFHHDGAFPTAIPEGQVEVAAKTVELAL